MPVKYHCAKCGRRFIDWGAEKLGFKCPDCEDQELVRLGASEDRPAKRPSMKRGVKKVVHVEPVEVEEEEVYAEEVEPLAEVEEVVVGEIVEEEPLIVVDEEEAPGFVRSPVELIPVDPDEDEVDIDVAEDLNFGGATPPLADEAFEEADEETWNG